MTIRIGANPIGWSNDDMLEIGGETPLEQCLAEAREAGFVGMELGNKFPRDAATLRPILERYGHALVSGWYSTELLVRDVEAEWQAIRPHATLLREMDCSVLIVAETSNAIHGRRALPLSARPVLDKADWRQWADRLSALARRLKAEDGLDLVYHYHMGTIIEREAEIDRLMHETDDAVGLLLDTGHAVFAGADPERLARHYRARIRHIHAKDVREEVMWQVRQEDLSFLDAVLAGVYTVPGDGLIDYPPIFRALAGYSGWVVVEAEQDPQKADPATYARRGHADLSRFLKEGGLV
ncbi:myo-inosose-2 dehydratase [Arsenicitalea aurantiaca]|uniref:Myo-inosose-2 dehydratase n=1 Tax=Arsenicitalea aurantiaca TaxID=1783274 RepID=A0A433X5C8_9HYPH|nr:myo-inosose-2 dehydratase [Arsenicitalea aurantiaca]RUT29286.1 myo-inosose-2 dehydratase [Arsenicitalea aurantiaca]